MPPPTKKTPGSSSLAVKSRVGGNSTTEVKQVPKSGRRGGTRKFLGSGLVEDERDQIEGQCLSAEQIEEINTIADIEEAFNKMAAMLNLQNWREDMQTGIMMGNLFGVYQFAKENVFTPGQTSTFLFIMKLIIKKIAVEEKATAPLKTLEKFKALVVGNSGATNAYDLFSPRESKLVTDFAIDSVFQHFRLFQYVASVEQEITFASTSVAVEESHHVSPPQPLTEAITLEAYESELARLQELEEQVRLDKEQWEAAERSAAENPFDVLNPEEVKHIATEAVGEMLKNVAFELDSLLDEQGVRMMAKANQLAQLYPQ